VDTTKVIDQPPAQERLAPPVFILTVLLAETAKAMSVSYFWSTSDQSHGG